MRNGMAPNRSRAKKVCRNAACRCAGADPSAA
jgi:hypothetical protein